MSKLTQIGGKALSGWRLGRFEKWVIRIFVFLAFFGDFIANEKPLVFKYDGGIHVPILTDYLADLGLANKRAVMHDWHRETFDFQLRTPVPYSSTFIDLENAGFVSPFGKQRVQGAYFRHWLGTDGIGRDVLAGLIRGCRVALVIGLLSTFFALLIGLPVGAAMGYWGDSGLQMPRIGCVGTVVTGVLAVSIAVVLFQLIGAGVYPLSAIVWFVVLCGACLLFCVFLYRRFGRGRSGQIHLVRIPLDMIGMRVIEILRSLPGMFLVLACLGLMRHPSALFIAFLIGFIRWPTIARYLRAEVMKVKSKGYIRAARSLGLSDWRVISRHLMPAALGPVIVTVAFGFSSSILVESALSFLGLGLGIEEVSWGKLLNQARNRFDAWWLVLFPGLMIFLSVYVFNRVGEQLNEYLNPRLKS